MRPHSAAFESLVRLWGFLRTVDAGPFAFESSGLCGLQVGGPPASRALRGSTASEKQTHNRTLFYFGLFDSPSLYLPHRSIPFVSGTQEI